MPPFSPPVTPLQGLASHPWAYPLLESAHLLGISLLLGSLALVEWRVWQRGGGRAARALGRLALPITLGGFVLAAGTGLVMFATQPAELLANRPFQLKLALVMLAGLNAASFHARDGLGRGDGLARAQTVVSAGLWLAALVCGRMIAYV